MAKKLKFQSSNADKMVSVPIRAKRLEVTDSRGFSLVELVVVMGMSALVLGMATMSFKSLEGGVDSAADLFASTVERTRGRATATTTPHRVVRLTDRSFKIQYGKPCGSTTGWTDLKSAQRIDLPEGTKFQDWTEVCFTTRGWTSAEQVVTIDACPNSACTGAVRDRRTMTVLRGGSIDRDLLGRPGVRQRVNQ